MLDTRRDAQTPSVGLGVDELWQQSGEFLGKLPAGIEGLVVAVLQNGGPAAKAGLRVQDVITSVDGEKVIRHLERYSRPGRRVYQSYKDVKRVLDGLGIAILSTSRGVMSDRQARKNKVGGEVICTVW